MKQIRLLTIVFSLLLVGQMASCLKSPTGSGQYGELPDDDEDAPLDLENTFPQLMAFRAENTLGHGVTTGLENYDIIHTGSSKTIGVMLESSDFDNKKIIFHGSHAAVVSDYRNEVYPGHWLFASGTTITRDLTENTTTFRVDNPDVFLVDDQAMISYRNKNTKVRDWVTTEEVIVTAIDTSAKKITVKRGQFGTSPLTWDSTLTNKEIAITPHIYQTPQIIGDAWSINVSLNSPIDPDTGLSGYEFYAQWVYDHSWVEAMGGEGDGIQFDSGHWNFNTTDFSVDADNDGTADYGLKNGVNVYGLGCAKYIALLRDKLPQKAILQIDSSNPSTGYRFPKNLNGIEMESFPMGESYDDFSSAFLHLRQWINHTDLEPMSYPFTKDDTELYKCDEESADADDSKIETNSSFRIGFATALLLGMPHAYAPETNISNEKCFGVYTWDEYFGGSLNERNWLGAPTSEALQIMDNLESTNLLASATWTAGDKNSNTTEDNDYKYTSTIKKTGSLYLDISEVPQTVEERSNGSFFPGIDGVYFIANISTQLASSKEYTISFTAKAKNTYNNDSTYSEFTKIPRLLRIKLNKGITVNKQALLVWEDEQDFIVNFKFDQKTSIDNVIFESGEETGNITIKNIELHSGTSEHWVRYFEGGAVILNMGDTDWEVELDTTYSKNGFQRLTGTYDAEINNGKKGSGTSKNTFIIPARDALVVKNIAD